MTSIERIHTALSFRDPDRIPLVLPFTFYGAREMEVSIEECFERPDRIVDAHIRLNNKFRHDTGQVSTWLAGLI